jgi:rhamnulokinase
MDKTARGYIFQIVIHAEKQAGALNMSSSKYLAFDLGASSGRAIIGTLDEGKLTLEEVHRFDNDPSKGAAPSIGISKDSSRSSRPAQEGPRDRAGHRQHGHRHLGVDYVIVKKDGSFAREPYNYRDSRTDGVPEEVFKIVSEEELYKRGGIQRLPFNTIFQLRAHKKAHPRISPTARS